MTALETIAVAFAMFSALPVPQPVWNERNMRYALCAFPLVGTAVGICWWGWSALCGFLEAPALLRAAGLCALPALVTGGIHLDGYADTCDALASCGSVEKKRSILEDPHCGAFAVIRLCLYFVLMLGICSALPADPRTLCCAGLGFMLSRALSGFAVAAFPLAKDTGLAHTFAAAADRVAVRRVLLALSMLLCAGLIAVGDWAGAGMALAALAVLAHYRRTARVQFGGLSGDLAGWFLQRCEFWMLAVLAVSRMMEAKR